ncbi:Acg family FMN-binding oxidoreductase [Caulobacter sp.]|uniref:Acg family FMN-binding oxidoreductase n=1 Tax=Caulobacter sp. TaxID=78 RepID=UPI003BAD69A0
MTTRRAVLGALPLIGVASCGEGGDAYADAVTATWALPPAPGAGLPVQALVHAATLAASGHNTQPWRFTAQGRDLIIQPDLSRRTPVVDPDDHHLFVSLGCAAETLLQAAAGYGWSGEARFIDPSQGVAVSLSPRRVAEGPLFAAIAHRASTRGDYDPRPVASQTLRALAATAGPDVAISLITDRARLNQLTDLIVEGDGAQLGDPAFRRELVSWIRFDAAEALARRDGLFTGASGNPNVPRWIGSRLFDTLFTAKGSAEKIVRQMTLTAGAAVFTGPSNDPAGWVAAGRAFTRFALTATALGLKLAFLNQPVEDRPARGRLAAWLGAPDRRPDLVVRFGAGAALPRSLRRPVSAVLTV